MKTFYKKKKKGFTLVEMMIAVSLFTIALTGLMYMSFRGLNASTNAQNRVVGSYLALEALESVRNYRDSEFIDGSVSDWSDVFGGTAADCLTGSLCHVTYAQGNNIRFEECSSSGGVVCPVYRDGNFYLQALAPGGSAELTPFRRSIRMQQISSGELGVTVAVSWPRGLVEYKTHLFLWSNT